MNDKTQIISMLNEEFGRWQGLLAGLSEEQITAPNLPADLSIQDVIAHLMAWQQRSNARLEAALHNRQPEFPAWPAGLDPETEDVDQINAWIYNSYHSQPWSSVQRAWAQGFRRLLELAQAIPEKDLLDADKYPWMDGQPLSAVLLGTYEHHHEDHLEPLLAWLRQNGKA
jgi:hypothetical protein